MTSIASNYPKISAKQTQLMEMILSQYPELELTKEEIDDLTPSAPKNGAKVLNGEYVRRIQTKDRTFALLLKKLRAIDAEYADVIEEIFRRAVR